MKARGWDGQSPGTPVHPLTELVAPSTSSAGVILKLSLFANYFLSPLPFPSPVYNPSTLCVWFGAPASPPARGAETPMGCTSFCPTRSIPEKPGDAGGKPWCSSVPLRQPKCHPRALKHHWAHAPHLTQLLNTQREGSPSISTVTQGQGPQPSLAGWRVFRANTSFSGKKKDLSVKDLSFCMQRWLSVKKSKTELFTLNSF